jgi:hypothetical protein
LLKDEVVDKDYMLAENDLGKRYAIIILSLINYMGKKY